MHFFKNRTLKQKTTVNYQSFEDKETWSLDVTIAKFTVPRLKRFITIHHGIFEVSESDKEKYSRILKSLEFISNDYPVFNLSKKETADLKKGLKEFGETLPSMWW